MPLDWTSSELATGLACYRSGEFFEAHEHWELAWLLLSEPEKSFLQTLIQITAAMHHAQRGNHAGALSLLRRVQTKLAACPPEFGGIAVAPLRDEVSLWLESCSQPQADHPATSPQIRPLPLPKA